MTNGSFRLAVVLAAALMSACTSGSGTSLPTTTRTEIMAPSTTAIDAVTTVPRVSTTLEPVSSSVPVIPSAPGITFGAEDVFIRGCDSQVYGSDVNVNPGDRLGPLVLFLLSELAPQLDREFLAPSGDGELGIQKYVTQLEGDEAVWLSIAADDRAHASLIYDSARWGGNQDNRLPIEAGDAVVRFDACDNPSGHSQYNGGILVHGPRCITLEVWADGDAKPLATVPVQFGQESDCALIRETASVQGEDRVEVPFDSPGLDWTSSTVTVLLNHGADVGLSIRATQGTLQVLDGPANESSACRNAQGGWLECVIRWPILEAQSAGEWTLVVENRSPEDLELELAIKSNQAITG